MDNNLDVSKYMIDSPISISDRVTSAVSIGMAMASQGVTKTLLAPVQFFKALLTKTEKILDIKQLPKNHPLYIQIVGTQESQGHPEGEEEGWLSEHKKYFDDES